MPVLLVLFGVVFVIGALLGRRREAVEKPRPPTWSDPHAPADSLAAPRHHSEHPHEGGADTDDG